VTTLNVGHVAGVGQPEGPMIQQLIPAAPAPLHHLTPQLQYHTQLYTPPGYYGGSFQQPYHVPNAATMQQVIINGRVYHVPA